MNFQGVLGHEFVGTVIQVYQEDGVSSFSYLVHQRVCGEINLPCKTCSVCCIRDDQETVQEEDKRTTTTRRRQDAILARNHCPRRTVLGILNKQGTMAQYLTLPISNLHVVPSRIPDPIAVFAEPLAAALRIVEQNLIVFPFQLLASDSTSTPTMTRTVAIAATTGITSTPSKVAILGDGKLGLMIAHVLGRIFLQHLLYPYFFSSSTEHQPFLSSLSTTTTSEILTRSETTTTNFARTVNETKCYLKNLATKYSWIETHKPTLIGKHVEKLNLLKNPFVDADNNDDGDSNDKNSSSSSSLIHTVLLSECMDVTTWNGVSLQYSSQFDVVIDATGSPSGLTLASKLCKPLGTLVLKTTCATGSAFNTAPFVIDELHVVGSRCGPIDQALDFLNTYYETDPPVPQKEEKEDDLLNLPMTLRKLAPFYVDRLIHGIYPIKVRCLYHP